MCIARLKRGSVEVLAHAWDADLGATHFIDILFDICASDFQRRHGLDVHTNPKAAYRLRHECAKALRVLSANKDAHVLAECLMQDHDLATSITRQQLEAAAAPLLQRLLVPMRDAAQRAGLTGPDQLDTVELTGGGGRIPAVSDMVQGALGGREPARSLNSKEAAAEGCAWTAALLCGRFKYVVVVVAWYVCGWCAQTVPAAACVCVYALCVMGLFWGGFHFLHNLYGQQRLCSTMVFIMLTQYY